VEDVIVTPPSLPQPLSIKEPAQDLQLAQLPPSTEEKQPEAQPVAPVQEQLVAQDQPEAVQLAVTTPEAPQPEPQADNVQTAALEQPVEQGPDAPEQEAASVPQDPPAQPTILKTSSQGVEVLQSAPLAPGDVALDAISYDEAGEVLLAGRGDEDAHVRVYLDNAPLTTTPVDGDGRWQVELPQVDTGTYTLRVDQLDEQGDVTARVESPFLRESPQALQQAAQSQPETEAAPIRSITVQPGHSLWRISRERYGDGTLYVALFKANRDKIRDPDLIYPGQIFDLPE
jgi:nucleoid-associated protein YgaU